VVLLIAHPKKTQQGQQLDNESISGSGDITNRVDLVMTYSKNIDTDAEEYQSKIAITKNRLTGRLLINEKSVKVKYSNKSKRIVCENDNSNKKYSFEISEIKEIEPPPF
jgi:twinkle protein